MVKKYQLTSKLFEGEMLFTYVNGIIHEFENKSELDSIQIKYMSEHFPFTEIDLVGMRGKELRIIELVINVTFDMMIDRYGKRDDKAAASAFFKKMTKEDIINAYMGIPAYVEKCKKENIAMLYLVRYLRNRRWEDGR